MKILYYRISLTPSFCLPSTVLESFQAKHEDTEENINSMDTSDEDEDGKNENVLSVGIQMLVRSSFSFGSHS